MAEPLAYSVGMWTTKSGQSDAFVKIWKDMANLSHKTVKVALILRQLKTQINLMCLSRLVAGKIPMYSKYGQNHQNLKVI